MKIEEYLKAYLAYDPVTGITTWIRRPGARGRARGSVAGSVNVNGDGYCGIRFNGTSYKTHRVAWLLKTGAWPEDEIDHINGVRHDNRWVNLRSVTKMENQRNAKRRSDNTSGVVGVMWDTGCNKWRGYIKAEGEQKHLGLFVDFDDACAARKAAELKYGFHENHGRS